MTLPIYTASTIVAVGAAVVFDVVVMRTRLTAGRTFWITVVICWCFQVFVDGWLTKADGTIVSYRSDVHAGLRVFFNSPIEDFGFGFALILITLSVWQRLDPRRPGS
jgi:lycopene cyclase domain-containing protein